jgi:hypothetical protein
MGHYSKECPNLPTLATRNNAGFFTRRFSAEEKGKVQVHLIELINEGRENALMGLEKSLKSPEDVMDVMAQTKRSAEDTTHPDATLRGSRRWRKPQKKTKELKAEVWFPRLSNF